MKLSFKIVMDNNAFRLEDNTQLVQTIQKVIPDLFSVRAVFNIQELDFVHCPIIVEKWMLF
ncbi:MAG: hypothetical protein CVU42_07775 [Chloroflexi bacterium HGW-Chloroflexi-4]|nr:MAG: hypothetical protein CVU42_07775 [Chloroflexi bacterium HGW-Chloroflexi-4]